MALLETADRAHRLSGAAGGAAARRAVPRRARRVVPLGRHHPGHHRHRDGDADPRGARARRADLDAIADALAGLARKYRDTPMAGRSNLQQAVPITFGYKMATAARRHSSATRSVCRNCAPRVLVGEFGGAAGNLSSLGTRGLEVQAALMEELDSASPRSPGTRCATASPRPAASSASSPARSARSRLDVKLMMQTEVEEVYEPFAEGRGSSSTMPQKRNPISSNYITACIADGAPERGGAARRDGRGPRARDRPVGDRMDRGAGDLPVSPPARWRRRGSWSTGLQVDEKRMRANLDLTSGLIVSEAVMMGLGPYLGRQRAHDLVYDICRKVIATGRPFLDLSRRGQGDLRPSRPRRARQAGRSRELSRPRRRDGRPRAGDAAGIRLIATSRRVTSPRTFREMRVTITRRRRPGCRSTARRRRRIAGHAPTACAQARGR